MLANEPALILRNKTLMTLFINKLLSKVGVQVKRYPDADLKRRMRIVHHFKIDTLLDVGANAGQYAKQMRELGYAKRIISFEPVQEAFQQLSKAAKHDGSWIVNQYALGDKEETVTINVSQNSFSSSILNILPEHVQSAPSSAFIAQQETRIKKLDTVFDSFTTGSNNIMLKIDVQGFEKKVLAGAEDSLQKIKIIQLEMSLVPLYQNEWLFHEVLEYLTQKGFQLYSLENGFFNKETGQLLQADGIFLNTQIS